jgi:hypothetical protein
MPFRLDDKAHTLHSESAPQGSRLPTEQSLNNLFRNEANYDVTQLLPDTSILAHLPNDRCHHAPRCGAHHCRAIAVFGWKTAEKYGKLRT